MKAILLVRVSTKTQDFDEQERAIYEMRLKTVIHQMILYLSVKRNPVSSYQKKNVQDLTE